MKKFICICLIAIALTINPHPAEASSGGEIFTANCAGCHAKGGNIIRRGKNLKAKALNRNGVDSPEAIISLVTGGKGIMPAYRDRLTAEEIDAVSHYVLEQAATDWKS